MDRKAERTSFPTFHPPWLLIVTRWNRFSVDGIVEIDYRLEFAGRESSNPTNPLREKYIAVASEGEVPRYLEVLDQHSGRDIRCRGVSRRLPVVIR